MADILRMLSQLGGGFGPGAYSGGAYRPPANPYAPQSNNQLNQLANQHARQLQQMRQRVPQWTPTPNPAVRTVTSQPAWMTQPTRQFLAPASQTTMQQPTTAATPAVDRTRTQSLTGDMPVPGPVTPDFLSPP